MRRCCHTKVLFNSDVGVTSFTMNRGHFASLGRKAMPRLVKPRQHIRLSQAIHRNGISWLKYMNSTRSVHQGRPDLSIPEPLILLCSVSSGTRIAPTHSLLPHCKQVHELATLRTSSIKDNLDFRSKLTELCGSMLESLVLP